MPAIPKAQNPAQIPTYGRIKTKEAEIKEASR
jgi:hypothetical protein